METKDRLEPGSAASDPSYDTTQPKNNVLELSFKTRRHFVFCSTATSPRRKPILGLGQGLRAGLKLDPLQDMLVGPNAGFPLSSSAMFLEDHDYSSPAKRGGGLETGICALPGMITKQKLGSVMYNGLGSDIPQYSKISAESIGDDPMHAICEEAIQVECDVGLPRLGDKINRQSGSDAQGICDLKNCDSHSSRTAEVSKFLAPSSLTVKVQKLDGHRDGGTTGFGNSTSAQARNPMLRSSWSSSFRQNSLGRKNRCVKSGYPDFGSPPGAKAGPPPNKYQLFEVDMGSHSTTAPHLSTFCDDQPPYMSARPASGSLDSAQTGMIIPSPFLIQTGLEKTLDFAEFHPMSPSNIDWDNEFCCSQENGLETPLFENEMTKTCELSGVSPFDGQDLPVRQNLFCSPPDPNQSLRMQKSVCGASDTQTTNAKAKQRGKWCGKRQEGSVRADFDAYPFTLEDLQVRRRKPVKRQLDFGCPVEMSEETVNDLDQKRERGNTLCLNRTVKERQEQTGKDLQLGSTEEKQKARRPRKTKKFSYPGNADKEEFDLRSDALEKTENRPVKKYRFKSEQDGSGAHSDVVLTTGKAKDQLSDVTSGQGTEKERLSKRDGHSDVGHQTVPAYTSADFCDILSMLLDRWLEYLMTPHDVMHRQAIDDARHFGYNEDALDMMSNGDLEVWRILEDMEPEFVRSGIENYFV